MHEHYEHTADLGLRATAADLDTLFAEMARCLFAAILENAESVRPASEDTVTLAGTDREYLLFDWLRELLLRFDADHWLLAECAVRVTPDGLTATVRGEPFDPTRHELAREVKAITYHDLKVEPTPDGWLAEVIVDI